MVEQAVKERTDTVDASLAPNNLPAIAEPARQERKPRLPKIAAGPQAFPAKIAKAVIAITKDIGIIQKDGVNSFQKYKYTKWEDINDKLSPLLAEHGLIIVQSEISRDLLEKGDKGSVLAIVYHFTLVNEDGDSWPEVEWTAIARLTDAKGTTDDKAASKCHTQAEKQFCIKQFKIRTDDFVDADQHQTLPKKDARDIYTKLQAEIDTAESRVELGTWAKNNAERIEVLPRDWQGILRERYAEKLGDLRNQEGEQVVWEDEDPIDMKTGEVLPPSR